ncbi:restriction endonuclease subunit S [Bacillus sp. SH7-1]|uniref:restriction endonuclease subunit S n=1 Tax=Bacillus sp. SH7-1 TaxID=2217818 RepID=UPI000BED3637|nr:restriction endonuclease subunit S [Bacillus sp. SH7-1]PEE15327.1 hypothetical protein CON53_25695 [Bacillus cereus]TXR99533.1 restriction endonuclease subunit S [Bacillus sp. SH7-1]
MVNNLNAEKPNCNWSESPLNTLLVLLKDGTHNPPKRSEIGIPLLSAVNIQDGKIIFDENVSFIKEVEYKQMHKNYEIQEEDVLLTIVGTLGRVAEVPKLDTKFTVQRSVAILRTNIDLVTPRYLRYYMESSNFQNQLKSRSNVTAQAGIYLGELGKLRIRFPNLHEQSKIASILSTVDETIEKTEAIIEQTEKVKKGLMQQLFTKGIGHTRFKKTEIGEIPVSWSVEKLNNIAKIIDCKHYTPQYCETGIPIVRTNNLTATDLILDGSYYTSEEDYFKLTDKYTPKKGDIIYGREGSFGVASYVNTDERFSIGQRVVVISPLEILGEFLHFALNADIVFKQVLLASLGTTVKRINVSDIKQLLIPLPPRREQEEIVNILLQLVQRSENEQMYLATLNKIKRGLMQSLLTGKVRVKVDEDEVTQV